MNTEDARITFLVHRYPSYPPSFKLGAQVYELETRSTTFPS